MIDDFNELDALCIPLNDEILPTDKIPQKDGYYYVEVDCLNCGKRFHDRWVDVDATMRGGLLIKKGITIYDTKCPVCGCERLIRKLESGKYGA